MSRGPMGEEAAWHAGAVYHIGGAAAISQPALKQAGTLLDGTTTFLAHPPKDPDERKSCWE